VNAISFSDTGKTLFDKDWSRAELVP